MSRYQERYKLEAMRGMGVDRHLFGLYVVAKGMKMDPLPRIFRDKVPLSTNVAASNVADAFFLHCNCHSLCVRSRTW